MRLIAKMLFASAIVTVMSTSAMAQQQTQGRTQQGQGAGQGGGNLGEQIDLTSNLSDMTFSRSTNTGISASNPFSGFYGNYAYMGRVGSSGMQQGQYTGGFGQALYSTGTTGGGAQSRTGGATGGMTGGMTGAGGNFGGTSTGMTGARTGTTGATSFGGTGGAGGTAATSFGGAGATTGGTAARGGQMGMTGMGGMGQAGMGGMGMNSRMGGMGANTQSANIITGDRPIATVIGGGTGGILPANAEPMFSRAQIQIRTTFDNSNRLISAKTIDIAVNEAGVARLTGSVSSPDEKRLAAGLAQITPGVRAVVNELTVSNP